MPFQSQVYILAGEGIQGTISRVEPVYGRPAVAGDANVVSGKFVFAPASGADGVKFNGFGAAGTVPAGVAIQNGSADDRVAGPTLAIAKDTGYFLMTKGYCWTKATTTATYGQLVLVDPATGVITTGTAASGTAIDSGWRVVRGGAAGKNIEIATKDVA